MFILTYCVINIYDHAADVPSTLSLAEQWAIYVDALERLGSRDVPTSLPLGQHAVPEYSTIELKSTGVFGSPGFSAGAFLRSPYQIDDASSNSTAIPDIQLTVFPAVR